MLLQHQNALMDRMKAMYPNANVRFDRFGNILFELEFQGAHANRSVCTTVLSDTEWESWVKVLTSWGYSPVKEAR